MKTIERLKQLLARATRGPWATGWNDGDDDGTAREMVVGPQVKNTDGSGVVGDQPFEFVYVWGFSCFVEKGSPQQAQAQVNATLMAESRNALPALLAVVEAAEELSDNDDTPEPNCSCHLCPPCNDCVTYAGKREIMATMKAALRALEGGE